MTAFAITGEGFAAARTGSASWAGRHGRRHRAPSARAARLRAPGGPRRHPRRDPRAPRRGADARLPDHPGARRADRRRLAAEPRLRLPDAPAARGRGARPRDRRPSPASASTSSPTPGREQAARRTRAVDSGRRRERERARRAARSRPPGARRDAPGRPRRAPPRRSSPPRPCCATRGARSTGCWPRTRTRPSQGEGRGSRAAPPPSPGLQSIACFARKTPSGSTSARISVSRLVGARPGRASCPSTSRLGEIEVRAA